MEKTLEAYNQANGRTVFAIYNGKCITKHVTGGDIEHRIYLKREFGVSADEYNHLVRGYINKGEITLYKTNGYTISDDIPAAVLKLLLLKSIELFGCSEVKLFNDNNGKPELMDIVFDCAVPPNPKDPTMKLYFAKHPQV
jgi:hypothetical protein